MILQLQYAVTVVDLSLFSVSSKKMYINCIHIYYTCVQYLKMCGYCYDPIYMKFD